MALSPPFFRFQRSKVNGHELVDLLTTIAGPPRISVAEIIKVRADFGETSEIPGSVSPHK